MQYDRESKIWIKRYQNRKRKTRIRERVSRGRRRFAKPSEARLPMCAPPAADAWLLTPVRFLPSPCLLFFISCLGLPFGCLIFMLARLSYLLSVHFVFLLALFLCLWSLFHLSVSVVFHRLFCVVSNFVLYCWKLIFILFCFSYSNNNNLDNCY